MLLENSLKRVTCNVTVLSCQGVRHLLLSFSFSLPIMRRNVTSSLLVSIINHIYKQSEALPLRHKNFPTDERKQERRREKIFEGIFDGFFDKKFR